MCWICRVLDVAWWGEAWKGKLIPVRESGLGGCGQSQGPKEKDSKRFFAATCCSGSSLCAGLHRLKKGRLVRHCLYGESPLVTVPGVSVAILKVG